MKNKKILVPVLFSCLVSSPLVFAENYGATWSTNSPDAKFSISLSGECSGTVTDYVSYVSLGVNYQTDDNGDVVSSYGDRANTNSSVSTQNGFGLSVYSSNKYTGDSFVETLKAGKRTSSFTAVTPNNHSISISSLTSPGFASQFKCKSGKTLSEALANTGFYIDRYDAGNKFKTQGQLVVKTDTPNEATFSLKQAISGQFYQASSCTGQRPVDAQSYVLKCAEAKKIKIKMSLTAKGTMRR